MSKIKQSLGFVPTSECNGWKTNQWSVIRKCLHCPQKGRKIWHVWEGHSYHKNKPDFRFQNQFISWVHPYLCVLYGSRFHCLPAKILTFKIDAWETALAPSCKLQRDLHVRSSGWASDVGAAAEHVRASRSHLDSIRTLHCDIVCNLQVLFI